MPPALEPLVIHVRNNLDIDEIVLMQKEAKFYEGKWHIELWVMEPGKHLHVVKPGA
jgi:hypothetical protein